ncbi:MAG: N-acetyltransferase [Spirochaetes bacterium]|nr:N-acetyltransferase [Spirochaetota bacterium]
MTYTIRTATTSDIESIYKLIKHYADIGVILERSMDDIKSNISSFIVAVADDRVVGTITYYDYEKNLIEVRSLAVEESYHRFGIGRELLLKLISQVKNGKEIKIFTLTYRPDFFEKNGFIVVSKENFPEKIWKDCDKCRDKEKCGETALVYNG